MEEEKIPFCVQLPRSIYDEMVLYFDENPDIKISEWISGLIYQGLFVGHANKMRRNNPVSSPIDVHQVLFGKK